MSKIEQMYKENTRYKLIGYQPVDNIPRTEIAEWKNGHWYPCGCKKRLVDFFIKYVIEI